MILSIGIPYVGISLACMKLFLGPREENKGPLLKEHFLPLLSHLCASKLTSMLQEISSVALATKCLFFSFDHYYHNKICLSGFRKRLLLIFLTLRQDLEHKSPTKGISYRGLKVMY